MAKFEFFIKPPKVMNLREKPRVSMFDRHIAAIRLEQEAKAAQIQTEEELHSELYDFSFVRDLDEYGFPKRTRYQIPDFVPDTYVPPSQAKVSKEEQVSQAKVSKEEQVNKNDSQKPENK